MSAISVLSSIGVAAPNLKDGLTPAYVTGITLTYTMDGKEYSSLSISIVAQKAVETLNLAAQEKRIVCLCVKDDKYHSASFHPDYTMPPKISSVSLTHGDKHTLLKNTEIRRCTKIQYDNFVKLLEKTI